MSAGYSGGILKAKSSTLPPGPIVSTSIGTLAPGIPKNSASNVNVSPML